MGTDEKLFLEYYNKFLDKIYNYVWYRVRNNSSIAEDLTSEIFLKAFSRFSTYDREKSFQAWIYAIARNHLLNHYRTADREISLSEGCSQASSDGETEIQKKLEAELVIKNFKILPESYREILALRYIDHLSNREIAELMSLNEGAVKTKICRALKQLKENINGICLNSVKS